MVSDRKKKRAAAVSVETGDAGVTQAPAKAENGEPSAKRSKKSSSSKKKMDLKKSNKNSESKKKMKREEIEFYKAIGFGPDHCKEDLPLWPEADMLELIRKIEMSIPNKDTLRHESRSERLDWVEIAFRDHSAEQCKTMWNNIQRRLRRFRVLREMVEDAKVWVTQPWTNFYRSVKQNRHPDQPRRPLSTYMIFYLEKKDKVAKDYPGLEMTSISKIIAEMYKQLTDKQKQKFVEKAAQQRRDYEKKLEKFYIQHPELIPKITRKEKANGQNYPGPKKPCSPYQMFLSDRLAKHKNDPEFCKATVSEMCREQWKTLSTKKKLSWINVALEDESRYYEELEIFRLENPDFVPLKLKSILSRDERLLKERSAGKPEKPPNSGYSLFSRIMLSSDDIKRVTSKERMVEISRMWRDLKLQDKRKYHDKVQQMLEQYKLEYATYLESLPPEKREQELQSGQRRKVKPGARKTKLKEKEIADSSSEEDEEADEEDDDDKEEEKKDDDDRDSSPVPPPSKKKKDNAKVVKKGKEKPEKTEKPLSSLYKGEPEPPPVMAYKLFLKSFMTDATHIADEHRMKEAPRYWQMLPETEKAKYRKKLVELKQKYIANYEKFLKSLSQEELKEYSLLKAKCKQSEEESREEDSEGSDQESGSEDDENGQQSDEVRVAGIVRTASFPPLLRRNPRRHATDLEESDSASSSGSGSDSDSSNSGSNGSGSDSDSESG